MNTKDQLLYQKKHLLAVLAHYMPEDEIAQALLDLDMSQQELAMFQMEQAL